MQSAFSKRLGRLVALKRAELGLTQEALASRVGLHRTYICDVERGARNLSLRTFQSLAAGLEIPAWKLLYEMEDSL